MRPLLTPREKEVCALLCVGKTNKEVAHELGISHRTVEDHRINILKKYRARNMIEVVLFVHNIVEPA